MVVLLTLGLSLASRSTQDLFSSQQQVESTRVFNAAEAGIEEALSTSLIFEGTTSGGSIDDFGGTAVDVSYSVSKVTDLETRVFEMVSVMVDTTGVITGQNLQIDWAHEDDCSTQNVASLVVTAYYDDGGTTRVRHAALGGCDRSDGFTDALEIDQDGYHRRVLFPLQTGDQFVRIKPVYNDTHLRVSGDGFTLPVQYFNVRSEAVNTLGNETRAVEVSRTLPTAASIMDFALYSGGSIVK